jgi:hypothetical protein
MFSNSSYSICNHSSRCNHSTRCFRVDGSITCFMMIIAV